MSKRPANTEPRAPSTCWTNWRPPDRLIAPSAPLAAVARSRANGARSQSFNRVEGETISRRNGMPRNNNRGRSSSRSNNDWGVTELVRDRPIAAAAAAAGAAAAGLFLWSRRQQISQQLSNLSDQIGEWTQNMGSGDGSWTGGGNTGGMTTGSSSSGMSESGGGTAGLGSTSGGGASGGSASGRGRAKSTADTQQ